MQREDLVSDHFPIVTNILHHEQNINKLLLALIEQEDFSSSDAQRARIISQCAQEAEAIDDIAETYVPQKEDGWGQFIIEEQKIAQSRMMRWYAESFDLYHERGVFFTAPQILMETIDAGIQTLKHPISAGQILGDKYVRQTTKKVLDLVDRAMTGIKKCTYDYELAVRGRLEQRRATDLRELAGYVMQLNDMALPYGNRIRATKGKFQTYIKASMSHQPNQQKSA